jgi:hypothetical protein
MPKTKRKPIDLAKTIMGAAGKPVLDYFDPRGNPSNADPYEEAGQNHLLKLAAHAIFDAAVDHEGHEAYYCAADALQKASEELATMAARLYTAGDDINPEMKDADK